ncbi:hypothetical protein BH23BAC2_BH23BAC2_05420 [soil metagenome]
MLTSFFGKSKPINFIAVVIFMTVFYLIANAGRLFSNFNFRALSAGIGILLCFVISIIVLDFIAKKNDLTKRSAYKILIFAVFSVSFFAILRDNYVIVANLCVLLSLRRVISLKSQKEIQKKIFDATFWICIASLFYFWTILFLIVIYSGILMHTTNYFKNWLIPPVAIFAVVSLVNGFNILVYDSFYTFESWFQTSNFNFGLYQDPKILIPLSIILAITLWTLSFYFQLLKKASINSRPTYILVLLTLATAIALALFAPQKNGSELLFFFVPLSIITSNYFESKSDETFKEILLIGLLLMPVLIPVFF